MSVIKFCVEAEDHMTGTALTGLELKSINKNLSKTDGKALLLVSVLNGCGTHNEIMGGGKFPFNDNYCSCKSSFEKENLRCELWVYTHQFHRRIAMAGARWFGCNIYHEIFTLCQGSAEREWLL